LKIEVVDPLVDVDGLNGARRDFMRFLPGIALALLRLEGWA
jgi:hypothetical protein